jgi:hypothetical protein
MPVNPDPVEDIHGIDTAEDVSKTDFVAYEKSNLYAFATCAAVRNIDLSGRTRIMAGSRFFRKDTSDTSADDGTESTPTIIDGAGNHWLVIEGERYDLIFGSSGLYGDGEALPAYPVVIPLLLPAGLPGSVVIAAEAAPAADATITFKKSIDYGATWANAFTALIAAGQRHASLTLAADLSLPAGALLRPVMPSTHDASLKGLTAAIAAIR